ncbi:hypothetical protein IPV09_07570 [Tessaracoccus sp. SD287]|uniref:hypothetical protein n=1 Tax=Tessaracoccus sp. SD287 TaxID=2782008 RepID=UPI001A9692C0|nr:hypothetical protein [Tessaracoccus sp. SD287]MBO1031194.1 hypothetical protein [Tessaracoccus sp. SD287]
MSWYWDAELVAGAELRADDLTGAGMGRRFDDQGSAEAWLTESYLELTDLGIDQVSLYEEDRLVYGPMSLQPE